MPDRSTAYSDLADETRGSRGSLARRSAVGGAEPPEPLHANHAAAHRQRYEFWPRYMEMASSTGAPAAAGPTRTVVPVPGVHSLYIVCCMALCGMPLLSGSVVACQACEALRWTFKQTT